MPAIKFIHFPCHFHTIIPGLPDFTTSPINVSAGTSWRSKSKTGSWIWILPLIHYNVIHLDC